jgi:regulator of sigma E protease
MVAKAKAVHEANPIQRIFFMAAGAVANFIFAFILFAIVASIGIQQAVGGSVGVIDVKAGSVFEKAGIQNGDTILELNGEKFDDSTQFFSRLHSSDASEASLTIQKVGTGQRETITLSAISPNAPLDTKNYVQISGIVKGAPSEQAGMMPGDLVTAFNGDPIAGTKEFREKTKNNLGKEVAITLQRGQETLIVKLTPRTNPPARQGAIGILISDVFENTNLGFLWQEGDVQRVVMPLAFNQSVQYGIERVVSVITTTVQIPSQLVSGVISADEARPVSVIGMSQIGGGIIEHSIRAGSITPILDFIGVISVALGFFNLLPIPALDGGRILFALIEIARGRPVAPEREGFVHLVGLALLLSLSAVIILNDVVNPITNILR